MSPEQVVQDVKKKFSAAIDHFHEDLKTVRTGRAHPGMLDGVEVEAYGTAMPLIQVASITVPEPQLLQLTPFDPQNLAAISKAIREQHNLGLNPMDDGKVVRVPIPALTEERRKEYVKLVNNKLEQCMVSLRNARHEGTKLLDQAEKDKDIGKDDATRLKGQIDEQMASFKEQAEAAAKAKEEEIMTV